LRRLIIGSSRDERKGRLTVGTLGRLRASAEGDASGIMEGSTLLPLLRGEQTGTRREEETSHSRREEECRRPSKIENLGGKGPLLISGGSTQK